MLFANLKRILRLDRLRLRGPSGAKDEFLLATAQNLRNWPSLSESPGQSSPCEARLNVLQHKERPDQKTPKLSNASRALMPPRIPIATQFSVNAFARALRSLRPRFGGNERTPSRSPKTQSGGDILTPRFRSGYQNRSLAFYWSFTRFASTFLASARL
jgi:hypothetical protein